MSSSQLSSRLLGCMDEKIEDFKKSNKLEYYAKGKRSFVYRLKYKNKGSSPERGKRKQHCNLQDSE